MEKLETLSTDYILKAIESVKENIDGLKHQLREEDIRLGFYHGHLNSLVQYYRNLCYLESNNFLSDSEKLLPFGLSEHKSIYIINITRSFFIDNFNFFDFVTRKIFEHFFPGDKNNEPIKNRLRVLFCHIENHYPKEDFKKDYEFLEFIRYLRNGMHSNFVHVQKEPYHYKFNEEINFIFKTGERVEENPFKKNTYLQIVTTLTDITEDIFSALHLNNPTLSSKIIVDPSY